MHKFTVAAVVSLGLCSAASAHEFWLQPSQYHPDLKSVLAVRLRVGMGFPGEAVARNPEKIDGFFIQGPGGRAEIPGMEGRDPAGLVRLADVGVHVLVYSSKPTVITLDGAKFDAYLREEGLDEAVKQRAEAGESGKATTEGFSRCAKALLCCEKTNAAEVWKKPVGLKLELIPEADPYTLNPGASMSFVLLADGKPAERVLVKATNDKRKPGEWTTARTDAEGRVTFTFDESAVWLLSAVQIAPSPAGAETVWSSTWASLTFELPGPETKTVKGQHITRLEPMPMKVDRAAQPAVK